MQVWIECPQFHWIGIWTTHRLMHEHVGKRAKMQRSKESQMGGAKQARQAYQHRTKQRKVCIELINTPEVFSQVVKFKQASGGMDVTTQASGPKD